VRAGQLRKLHPQSGLHERRRASDGAAGRALARETAGGRALNGKAGQAYGDDDSAVMQCIAQGRYGGAVRNCESGCSRLLAYRSAAFEAAGVSTQSASRAWRSIDAQKRAKDRAASVPLRERQPERACFDARCTQRLRGVDRAPVPQECCSGVSQGVKHHLG
jgi:hypothetical protein